MATYGSTLDSLMANRVAQQAADAAEQNAYRSYLNAVANTNIRRSEGEALDRYRQGELGIRGQDVMGMNEYRRGQIGLGGRQIDMQTELGKQGLSNQLQDIINRGKYYEGIGQYYGAMPDVQRQQIGVQYELGRKGLENQALDIVGSNRYREGLISNQALDIGGSNKYREGLISNQGLDIGGMNRYREGQVGIGRMQAGTQAADVAARNQIAADVARMNYDLGGRQLTTQKEIASLQYDRIPAYQKAMFDLYSTNPQAAASMMGVRPTEMDLLRESKRQEEESVYNTAVMNAAQKALDQYESDDWWGILNPDNPSTVKMDEFIGAGLTKEQAARRYAEGVLAPLYGRGIPSVIQNATPQIQRGGTNAFSPDVSDYEAWKRSKSGK